MPVEIPLTRGFVAIIDEEDSELVMRYKWRAVTPHKSCYAVVSIPTDRGHTSLYMHRLILLGGRKTDTVVDHINGNGLDNRRANLRECTKTDNVKNKKGLPSNNSSGCIGLYWHPPTSTWRVSVCVNRENVHLGYFKNYEDAKKARREGELKYYGEFAPQRAK